MSQEILYTSAPAGLKPGSRGFCTVVATRGMAKNLADHLEDLSGYRHLVTGGDGPASANPVAFSHLKSSVGGRTVHVLSRICDAGFDYTQRTNKLAHHVALDAAEIPPGGPAALLAAPGFMTERWSGEPRVREAGPVVPQFDAAPAVCAAWARAAGDAGWAGVVAAELAGDSRRPIVLIYKPGTDVLSLIVETLALLPAAKRRQATFSTYVTKLPPTVDCRWRCYIDGTPEADAAVRTPGALVLDLRRPLGRAEDSPYVDAARSGKPPAVAAAPPPPVLRAAPSAAQLEADEELLAAYAAESPQGTAVPVAPAGVAGYDLAPPPVHAGRFEPRFARAAPPQRRKMSVGMLSVIVAAGVLLCVGIGLAVYLTVGSKQSIVAQIEAEREAEAPGTDRDGNEPAADEKPKDPAPEAEAKPAEQAPGKGDDKLKRDKGDMEKTETTTPSEPALPESTPPTLPTKDIPETRPPERAKVVITPGPFYLVITPRSKDTPVYQYADPHLDIDGKLLSSLSLKLRIIPHKLQREEAIVVAGDNPTKAVQPPVPEQRDANLPAVAVAEFVKEPTRIQVKSTDALSKDTHYQVLRHSVLVGESPEYPSRQILIYLRKPQEFDPKELLALARPIDVETGFNVPEADDAHEFVREYRLDLDPIFNSEFVNNPKLLNVDELRIPIGDGTFCVYEIRWENDAKTPTKMKLSSSISVENDLTDKLVRETLRGTRDITSKAIGDKLRALKLQVDQKQNDIDKIKDEKDERLPELRRSRDVLLDRRSKLTAFLRVVDAAEKSTLSIKMSVILDESIHVPLVTSPKFDDAPTGPVESF